MKRRCSPSRGRDQSLTVTPDHETQIMIRLGSSGILYTWLMAVHTGMYRYVPPCTLSSTDRYVLLVNFRMPVHTSIYWYVQKWYVRVRVRTLQSLSRSRCMVVQDGTLQFMHQYILVQTGTYWYVLLSLSASCTSVLLDFGPAIFKLLLQLRSWIVGHIFLSNIGSGAAAHRAAPLATAASRSSTRVLRARATEAVGGGAASPTPDPRPLPRGPGPSAGQTARFEHGVHLCLASMDHGVRLEPRPRAWRLGPDFRVGTRRS